MIVNTAVLFREVEGSRVPGFLFMSSNCEADRERLGQLRLELLLDVDAQGGVFLNATIPDRQELFARSQAFPQQLLEELTETLARDPGSYQVGICPADAPEQAAAISHGGDDVLDPTGEAGQGYRLLSAGDWQEASRILSRVRDRRPWVRGVRTLLGRCLAAQGQHDEAETAYRAELDMVPGAYLTLNNLGILYKRRGWLEHAFDCFVRALASYPNHYEGLINFSTVLFYFGDHGGVRHTLARALAVNPRGGLVERSLTALADTVGTDVTSLRAAVEEGARATDLAQPFQLAVGEGKLDLKRQEAYRCFVEEAFRDGRLETWEREVLSAAARLLDIPVDLQCRVVVEAQKKYWEDGLTPERALDKRALMDRLVCLAERDGVVKPKEVELLERVAALLKQPIAYKGVVQ